MFCAGIDYSMLCPSICIADLDKEFSFDNCIIFYLYKKKYAKKYNHNIFGFEHISGENNTDRYIKISEWAIQILKKFKIKNVALEGYSYSSKRSLIFNIAENTMCLKIKLHQVGINVITPSPNQIKKFYTGKGNSHKENMVTQFILDTNKHLHDYMNTASMFSKPIEDIVDSFAICKYMYETIKKV